MSRTRPSPSHPPPTHPPSCCVQYEADAEATATKDLARLLFDVCLTESGERASMLGGGGGARACVHEHGASDAGKSAPGLARPHPSTHCLGVPLRTHPPTHPPTPPTLPTPPTPPAPPTHAGFQMDDTKSFNSRVLQLLAKELGVTDLTVEKEAPPGEEGVRLCVAGSRGFGLRG